MNSILFVHKFFFFVLWTSVLFIYLFIFTVPYILLRQTYIWIYKLLVTWLKATVECSTSYDQVSFPPHCHLMYKINVRGRGWGQLYRPHWKSPVWLCTEKIMKPAHHKVSMYVWRTHTPFPFIPWLCISALDTAAVPTATGVLQKKKYSVLPNVSLH